VRGVLRLALTNVAIVSVTLGVGYVALALAGGRDEFLAPGVGFLAVGLALVVATLALRARAARERAARTARARATVVAVKPHPYIRIGNTVTVTLTVAFGGSTFSRRLRVSPWVRLHPGPDEEIDVVYEPGNPANFEPAKA
jgi:hypothetical protein